MGRLFGTDGVRGIAGEFLDTHISMKLGQALGTVLHGGGDDRARVLIGTDTRGSCDMLCSALCAGLCAAGADCGLLGVIPTPATAYLAKKYGADAAVMISASHNSYQYNGIKIFNGEGFKLSDESEELIEKMILDDDGDLYSAPTEKMGRIHLEKDALRDYTEYLGKAFTLRLDGMRIAIDASNGAASESARTVFGALGAECFILSAEPDGVNINKGCGSTHLEALAEYVQKRRLDIGIAFDGDADRCLAVDEHGDEVDGDLILAMLALDMKARGELKGNTLVGTVMSNYGLQKFCGRHGIGFFGAAVGDRNVLETIEREGYSLGGEQSGHIIIRSLATTGDGQLTALALLSLISRTGKRLSELASVMTRYPQHTVNITATNVQKAAVRTDGKIERLIRDAEEALSGHGRIVVRPSGTEPVIRIMVEHEDEEQTRDICEALAKHIQAALASE